jgi:hypothetical protein
VSDVVGVEWEGAEVGVWDALTLRPVPEVRGRGTHYPPLLLLLLLLPGCHLPPAALSLVARLSLGAPAAG